MTKDSGAGWAILNKEIIAKLEGIAGTRNVLSRGEDLVLYEYDGSVEKARPEAVVFPSSTADVMEIVKLAIFLARPSA